MSDTMRFKFDHVVSEQRIKPTHIYELDGAYRFVFKANTVTLDELENAQYECRNFPLRSITFSKEGFKMFLDFLSDNKEEMMDMCDYSTLTSDGIYLNLHIEDESQHLWIERRPNLCIGIHRDLLMKIDINLLYTFLE